MPYIDRKVPLNACPIMVSPGGGYSYQACGKPVKRTVEFSNGEVLKVCGIHAAAEDRKKKNREEWDLKFQAQEARNELDRQHDARLRELGVWYWDKAEVIRVLEELNRFREEPEPKTVDPPAAFLAERPYYSREHVEEIAEHARRRGIPFCSECADWHHPDEEHSFDSNMD